ncbi:protein clarinet-like isoform X2 [Cydia pomonella]|uniref:protein clarinet-like isoform X2 n=1 Tax=Cydia pomonella TaxID=82600 RepID=UPI002ADD5442|nr:protein clarinet-like isoform X2 [Cydia pomonella]
MQNQFKKPYPMSRISYPASDAELETWVEQTIQREITRGRMLQDQKSSLASERSNNVNVLIKSPKLANAGNFHRRTISKLNKRGRSKSPLMKNARMSSSASRDDSCRSYQSPRLGRPACSMRISELAAPTKRQCMASWRANANVLPEAMINRLKQRVTDQEPIVKVSDAVNCLKHNRRSSDTRNSVIITPSKRPSRKINKEAMQNKIQAEYKVLSDAFGIKIAELLMKPIVITLNSRLQNISNIISEEIYKIIKDTTTFKADKATNKRMVREISEKVTIWIAKILEDSEEKLLEEDLRDLEEQEGPVLDLLDDLVDSILHKCIKTPSDVLTPEFVSVTSEDVEKDDQQETDLQTADEEASRDDAITMDEKVNEDTIENDIMTQLNNVIDSVTQEDALESLSKVSDVRLLKNEEKYGEPDILSEAYINSGSGIQSQSDIKPEANTKFEPDIDVLYSNDSPLAMPEDDNDDEHHNESIDENISGSPELSLTQLPSNEITEPPMIENENKNDENFQDKTLLAPDENNVTDTNEEQNSNVSDAVEVITEELSEGKNKTVQFSKENLDSINDILKDQNNPLKRKNVHLEDEQLLENIAYFDRPHIDFAPPNEELLSDADESWPEMLPLTKPSASVTRSITSMGKILETDEMFSTALEDATEYLLKTTDSKKHNEDDNEQNPQRTLSPNVTEEIGDLQSSKDSLYVNEKGDQPDGPLLESEIYNPREISLLEPEQAVSLTSIQKDTSIILICNEDVQASELYDHIVWESDKCKFNQSHSPEHLQKDRADEDVNERQNDEELISQKFDYRVHLKDAPAWIRRGQGEPNVGPCTCMPLNYSGYVGTVKMKEREREYQKWCQDLDFILMNLDKWNKWLNYISKYITDLKRKAGKINRRRQRSPARTEEDVTWRQLHKRATGLEVQRKDQTVKLKIPSAPLKYCLNCGRRKPNLNKKRHHQSNLRNNAESKCKRHYRREREAHLRKN